MARIQRLKWIIKPERETNDLNSVQGSPNHKIVFQGNMELT